MFKKIIFILLLSLIIFIGLDFYNSQQTVECWWGVVYPSLSFIAVEDDEEVTTVHESMISSSDINYFYLSKDKIEEEPIKLKMAIVEWFKSILKKEVD